MSLQISIMKVLIAHGALVAARNAHASNPTPETAAAVDEASRFLGSAGKEAAAQIK